ncbi:MAG: hypothetical protein AAFP97_05925, partial [Pseudomonadota bacterium]
PADLDEGFARAVAVRELDKVHDGDETLSFNLPLMSGLTWDVGDRFQFEGQLWSVQSLETGAEVAVTARRLGGEVPTLVSGTTPETPSDIVYAGSPQLLAFDLPGRSGVSVGALLDPFEAVEVKAADQETRLESPVRVGATLTNIPRCPVWTRDFTTELDVFLPGAEPVGVETSAFLEGANRFAIETASGWEIIGARDVELIAPQTYRLSHLLRGLDGSEAYMEDVIPAGTRILSLASGLTILPISDDWRLSDVSVTGRTEKRDARSAELTWSDVAGYPLSPTHIRWDGSTLSWIGRDPSFTEWTEDASHLNYRVIFYRGDESETVETSETELSVEPFERVEIAQITSQGRASLETATLIVEAV